MSKYPGELNSVLDIAAQNRVAATEAHEAVTLAETETEILFGHIAAARLLVMGSLEQNNQDLAVISTATNLGKEALAALTQVQFSETNQDAGTAQKQLAEGIRLLGKLSRGYEKMQVRLAFGVADLDHLHSQVTTRVADSLAAARSMLQMFGTPKQEHVTKVTRAYIKRREDEYDDLYKSRNQLNSANQSLVAMAPEGAEHPATAIEARPTPKSIAHALQQVINELTPAGGALQEYDTDIAFVLHAYEAAGQALINWSTAPEDIKSKHLSLGEALQALRLPIESNRLNNIVERLKASQKDFEGIQTSQTETRGLINAVRTLLSGAAKAVWRYVVRRG